MKFKVGDKVKLLLSANPPLVYLENCDAEGIIINAEQQWSLKVRLPPSASFRMWWIDGKYLKLSMRKGQQLLFAFMED